MGSKWSEWNHDDGEMAHRRKRTPKRQEGAEADANKAYAESAEYENQDSTSKAAVDDEWPELKPSAGKVSNKSVEPPTPASGQAAEAVPAPTKVSEVAHSTAEGGA